MLDLPPDIDIRPSAYIQTVEKTNSQTKVKTKGIIKIPEKKSEPEGYCELIRSSKDELVIRELITTMSQKGKVKLLFIKHHMEELGDQVRHVHPLKFLGYIFANPDLKVCMKDVLTDYFKKSNFINGLAVPLNNEMRKGKLKSYLEDFCTEVGAKPYQVQPYFDRRDWEGLLHFLSNN